MRISRKAKIIILGLVVLIILPYLSLANYPKLVRGAYYRNPADAFVAFYQEYIKPKSFPREEAERKIESVGLKPRGSADYIYLTPEVKSNYFGLVTKDVINTQAYSFWVMPVETGLVFVETDSGRLIYLEQDALRDYSIEPRYYQ